MKRRELPSEDHWDIIGGHVPELCLEDLGRMVISDKSIFMCKWTTRI